MGLLTDLLGGGNATYPVAVAPGSWVLPGMAGSAWNVTAAITADTLYYAPWSVASPLTLDRLAIQVNAAAAGKSVRIGVYEADEDLQPGDLVVASAAIDVGTTGRKEVTISETLTTGNYVSALVSDGAPTLVLARADRHAMTMPGQLLQAVAALTVPSTFGALPATGTAWTTLTQSTTPFNHYVFARPA